MTSAIRRPILPRSIRRALDPTTRRTSLHSAIAWVRQNNRWMWIVPLLVFAIVRKEEARIPKAIEVLVGAAFLAVIIRRPYRWLCGLLIVLPFQTLILAAILRLGVPAQIVRGLRFWREAIVAGLALYALGQLRKRRELGTLKFDTLDKVAIVYVVLGTAFLFFPKILVGTGAGAHLSFYVRELGWRGDVLYMGIFLIFRHVGLTRQQTERVFRGVFAAGVVAAAVGIYEFFDPSGWTHFVNHTLRVNIYNSRVVGNITNPVFQEATGSIAGHHFPRIGTVLLDYLGAGFFFVICLGIGVELLVRGHLRWWIVVGTPLVGLALIFNQGRSAIVGGAIAVIFGLRAQIGRSIVQRVRLTIALGLVLIVAVPLVIGSGLGHRFTSATTSNQSHVSATQQGIDLMTANPLGRGLSTGAGAGQIAVGKGAAPAQSFIVSEDQWLQIGTQLGYLGLTLYVIAIVLIYRRITLKRDGNDQPGLSAAASRNALVGMIVPAFVLQPFVIDTVDWTLFGLCGLAAGLIDASARDARGRTATTALSAPDF